MISSNKKLILFILAIFGGVAIVYAQTNGIIKYEIGISAGVFVYQGDLTPSRLGSYRTMKPGFGIFGSKILNNALALRGNFSIGNLKGDESKYTKPDFRQQRNFNFRSPLIELTAQLVWNPLSTNYSDKGFSPYAFGGGGFSLLKVKRDWSKLNAEYFGATSSTITGLATDQQTTPPRLIPVVPMGVGIRYNFSSKFSAFAETSYRLTFTDYLDGFSKAANPDLQDHYLSHIVGIIYRIGKKNTMDCPVVRH